MKLRLARVTSLQVLYSATGQESRFFSNFAYRLIFILTYNN